MLPLQGLGVLVTRPEQQAQPLCRLLEAQGAAAFLFPVIQIRASGRHAAGERVAAIDSFDLIVFVSANAVRFGAALLEQHRDLPLAAIGPATARSLNQAGFRVAVQPEEFSSEGLLKHARLQQLSERKVLLIRGQEGRPLLEQELERRGAAVTSLEVYERVPAAVPSATLERLCERLQAGLIQVVTATSLDIGGRLLELAAGEPRLTLHDAVWLVPSARVAVGLRERGLRAPLLQAPSAQDQDLVSALLGWRRSVSGA